MGARPYILPIQTIDPIRAFGAFRDDPVAALLDSSDASGSRGRHAFIAADPYDVITDDGGAGCFGALQAALQKVDIETAPGAPPFQTGAVGVFSYELGGAIETLPEPKPAGLDFPAAFIGLYDTIAAFDLKRREAAVMAVDVGGAAPKERPPAKARARNMAARINQVSGRDVPPIAAAVEWRAEQNRANFEARVQRAIDYIYAGDIFQANITTRFCADAPPAFDPFDAYRALRSASPAPFAAYLACGMDEAGGKRALLSASPERFLRLTADGRIETRPIKGTRPRGDTPSLDKTMIEDLIGSQKDRAENLMIVDLLRNDISRVAKAGSVSAPKLMELETFARVHHLVSEVRALLRDEFGPVDLLRAAFPGGSVTGAPKIRAMEIINELEPARRGPYCGSVAWIGFDGAMDSSIIIRSVMMAGGRLAAHAGGGVVSDSSPKAEYEEMLTKIRPLLRALSKESDPCP